MIINSFKCEKCGREQQPEDILMNINLKGELIRICGYCENEVVVQDGKEVKA